MIYVYFELISILTQNQERPHVHVLERLFKSPHLSPTSNMKTGSQKRIAGQFFYTTYTRAITPYAAVPTIHVIR